MDKGVSVIIPAYEAQETIARAVRSALSQEISCPLEVIIIADDAHDYQAELAGSGISDERMRFLFTGTAGGGSPTARNLGLDAAQHRYAAILDADDYFMPTKLERALEALAHHPIVSSALQVTSPALAPLRTVGESANSVLSIGAYKFTNISMDSMLVHDRVVADPRFDPSYPCLTDIVFLLALFEKADRVFHLGTPLHGYVKMPGSISNRPGASSIMVDTKMRLRAELSAGRFALSDPGGLAGLQAFYDASLAAEQSYGPRLAAEPHLLFEDVLEGFLPKRPLRD